MVHRTYAEIEVEYIDPEMLKPAVYNPRKISEAEMKKLIHPDATLAIIERTHSYVDRYAVGTLNHHPHASHIDWGRFARDVVDKLEEVGANYYLKRDLRRYLREVVV